MKRRIPFAVVLVVFASTFARAQAPVPENPVCNAAFAQLLVAGQVMESKAVVEPVKRIKILIRSADFLWPFDQPTARAYFSEAFKMANDRFKETGFETKSPVEKGLGLIQPLPDQRMEVINAIAKRDAEWAKRLAEQMLADYDKAADRDAMDKTRELEQLLSLAMRSIKTNPELSRHLFRRVMRYPLFSQWFFTLYGAHRNDPAFADSLYAEVLRNYRNETPRRLLYLSAYPFAHERIFGVDKYQLGTQPPTLAPNPALQREFINIFFARIAVYAANVEDINRAADTHYQPEPVYMMSAIREIEPIVIERFPDMLQALSVAKAHASSLLTAQRCKKRWPTRKNRPARSE